MIAAASIIFTADADRNADRDLFRHRPEGGVIALHGTQQPRNEGIIHGGAAGTSRRPERRQRQVKTVEVPLLAALRKQRRPGNALRSHNSTQRRGIARRTRNPRLVMPSETLLARRFDGLSRPSPQRPRGTAERAQRCDDSRPGGVGRSNATLAGWCTSRLTRTTVHEGQQLNDPNAVAHCVMQLQHVSGPTIFESL